MTTDFEDYRPLCDEAAGRIGVVAQVHPDDFIFRFLINHSRFSSKKDAIDEYFNDGAKSARHLAHLVSEVCDFGGRPIELLEFASGFGCVTRHLRSALPSCHVVACDIHPNAIRFLREPLGTEAIQSATVPEDLNPQCQFDVVFALSFFSHMPKRTFGRWLQKLASLVRPPGFLIFTTHGAVSNDKMLRCELDGEGFFFRPESEQEDLNTAEYGTSIVLPRYVLARAFGLPNIELRYFREGFWWGHQDLYLSRAGLTSVSKPYNFSAQRSARHVARLTLFRLHAIKPPRRSRV